MLSVKNRFHGHGGVRRVYRTGKPVRGHFIGMHVNLDTRVKNTKVAVVVSKKINKSAVKRNRIRRRIYEIVRLELNNIKNSSEIVITVYQPDVIDLPHEKLKEIITDAFKKASL